LTKGDGILVQSLFSLVTPIVIYISALGAAQSEMVSFKGIGHTAGWNLKCFHHKCPDDKSQHEGGYQPFKGICDFDYSIFSLVNVLL
jgi:hypothetical protein